MAVNWAVLLCLTIGLLPAQVGPPGRSGGGGRGNPQQGGGPRSGQQNSQPQQQQPAATRPEDLGSIEGQVFNAATGEPLKRATLSLRRLEGRGMPSGASTDTSGIFSLAGIEPGSYRLFAERNGFVRQEFGARGPEKAGTPITLDKAQRLTGVALRLTPQAVITGRIVDDEGEPVRGVSVQAMRMGYNSQGRRQMIPSGSAQTNDLGEYRLYDIPGGKYYLSASMRGGPQTVSVGKERFVPAYYPGTADPASAMRLDVPAGTQMRGIDLTLRRGATVTVRGTIVNAATNTSQRGAAVRLVTRGQGMQTTIGQGMPMRGQGETFEIQGVAPGSYMLLVDSADQRNRVTYRQPLEVGPSGIDNLTVTIPSPADITGQIRMEGDAQVAFSGMNVSLRLRDPLPMSTPSGKVNPDGTFTIPRLMPDSYELNVSGLPAGLYVKSARFASVDILDSGLILTGGAGGVLEVTLSAAAAQLDGVVMNSKQQPAKGALVALVPDTARRSRTSLFKTASTDDTGHYSFQGIPPGDYSVYAFEDLDSGAYFDPDFLKPVESSAESVSLRESTHETRQLKQIPPRE